MRKIIITTIVLIFICNNNYTQNKAGSFSIGGAFGLKHNREASESNSSTKINYTQTNIKFKPSIEYFIGEDVSSLLELSLLSTTSENSNQKTTTNLIGLNIGARKYLMFGDKIGIFAQAQFGFLYGKTQTITDTSSIYNPEIQSFNIGVVPGLYIPLGDKFSFEARWGFLGFESYKSSTKINNTPTAEISSGYRMEFTPETFQIGLRFFFN